MASLGRLDAWYYLAPGAAAARHMVAAKVAGVAFRRLGGDEGLGRVWQPGRFKRAYAGRGEEFIPYLVPHDAFLYLPTEAGRLSLHRTANLERYRISRGTILQTCSGRNLGPNVIADSYLARYATSHDVLRIEIDDERTRNWVVAWLRSRTGQGLLRRDKSGSVIDHISVGHVSAQEIPMLDDATVDEAAGLIGKHFRLVEAARNELAGALAEYESRLPGDERAAPPKVGWTVRASKLDNRIDAAFHDPWVANIRQGLLDAGGIRVGQVADASIPERYKRIYVAAEHGTAFLSGSNVLQYSSPHQQYMAERAVKDAERHKVRKDMCVYQVDGRAEKALGVPSLVTSDRHGWMATQHIGRLAPKEGVDPGWLWLASRTWQALAQVKALASGSVVDALYVPDMERVILPPPDGVDGISIAVSWERFAQARAAEANAVAIVDARMAEISGVHDGSEDSAEDVLA